MHTIQHAFRVHLQHRRGLSEWSAVRYVTVAGALLAFCEERGYALERGEVPASMLVDFAASSDDVRAGRVAVLFCEFLRERGVALPELDALPGTLSVAQVEAFLGAAEGQPEPYATLLCLLPWSGLTAQDLRRLPREAVHESPGGSLSLVHEGARMGLVARAQERLRAYLAGWEPRGAGLLFAGRSGGAIAASTITRRLKLCRRAAGLPEFRASALSDVYEAHFFEPAPGEGAGAVLDGVVDDEDEPGEPAPVESAPAEPAPAEPTLAIESASEPLAPDVPDPEPRAPDPEPRAPDPKPRAPDAEPHAAETPLAEEPSEDPPMSYEDEPYDGPFDDGGDEPFDEGRDDFDEDGREPPSPPDAYEDEPRRRRAAPDSRRRDGRRRVRRPATRTRPRDSQDRGGTRRASARDVDGLLPKSGYIHIRRRDLERGGRPRYCGRYLVRDVAPDGSIEAFIFEKLAPTWGGGEYLVFTNANDLRPRAVVDIETPPPQPAQPGARPAYGASYGAYGPAPVSGYSPERAAAEAAYEAGVRVGRREVVGRDPYPYPSPPPYCYEPPLAMGGGAAPLPAPEPSGPPEWWMEDRRMQYEREKADRKAQLEREEREERRREADRQAQRERDERDFQRQQADLDRQRADLARQAERMEARLEKAALAAPSDPLEAAGIALDRVGDLSQKAQKLVVRNDNGGTDRGPLFDLAETAVGTFANKAAVTMGDVLKPKPRGASSRTSPPPNAKRRPKKKRGKKKRRSARAAAPPQSTSTSSSPPAAAASPPTAGAPPDAPPAAPPSPALPARIPGYVKMPASQLEEVIAQEQSESLILERLIGLLAALGAAPKWTPFVQAVLMHLMRNEVEPTLRGLGAILGALVRGDVLEEPTAHCVLHIAQERWDEAREAILVAYQQRQAGAAE